MQNSMEQNETPGNKHSRGDIIAYSEHLVKSSLINTTKVMKIDGEMENMRRERKWLIVEVGD